MAGWWYTYPPEKYQSVGMVIPNIWNCMIELWLPKSNAGIDRIRIEIETMTWVTLSSRYDDILIQHS